MTQAQTEVKIYSFDEFIQWLPEKSEFRYELHNGIIIEMPKPRGKHSKLTGSIAGKLLVIINELSKTDIWFIPRESIIQPFRNKSGYDPDIVILNEETISIETRWEDESIIENASSIKLIIEVVLSNWRDDYYDKLRDYEEMGIEEYWIVDYAALGGKKFIGDPKTPTISVCYLVEGEYQITRFTDDKKIISPSFPQFQFSPNELFRI